MSDPLSLAAVDDDDDNNNNNYIDFKINGLNQSDTMKETNIDENTSPPEVPPRNKLKKIISKNANQDDSSHKTIKQEQQPQTSDVNEKNSITNHVRWFYQDEVDLKKWIAFKASDSSRIEHEFKRNECVQGEAIVYEPIQVLEQYYEVDIAARKYSSIYWEGVKLNVLRGTWFKKDGEPLEEELAEQIEKAHVEKFSTTSEFNLNESEENDEKSASVDNSSSQASKLNKKKDTKNGKKQETPIYSIQLKDTTCYWYNEQETYLTTVKSSKSWSWSKKDSFKIIRGYRQSNDDEEKSNEITHLIFVIHGIAQKLYEKSIIKNCDDLRKRFEEVKSKLATSNGTSETTATTSNLRCKFIPVDWRSTLALDEGIIESITLQNIKGIRDVLNTSALDIMYYTSPLFRYEILESLSAELNRLYTLFIEKNPYFKKNNGKVSIVAHSLGSVITYDLITHNYTTMDFKSPVDTICKNNPNGSEWEREYNFYKQKMLNIEKEIYHKQSKFRPIEFVLENLFILGSPLAVFLTLRGYKPGGTGLQDHILPKNRCKHLYNLFHPCDPIAYRIEPLILKHYATIEPIDTYSAEDKSFAKHIPYKDVKSKASNSSNIELSSKPTSTYSCYFRFQKSSSMTSIIETKQEVEIKEATISSSKNSSSENFQIDQNELEKRFDYALPSRGLYFEAITALGAHTNYWKSLDVAYFILTQLNSN